MSGDNHTDQIVLEKLATAPDADDKAFEALKETPEVEIYAEPAVNSVDRAAAEVVRENIADIVKVSDAYGTLIGEVFGGASAAARERGGFALHMGLCAFICAIPLVPHLSKVFKNFTVLKKGAGDDVRNITDTGK